GCLSSESRGGRWYYFRPQANGIVRFEVADTDPGDFDFAVWDGGLTTPPATCPPPGPPIRCSSAPLDGTTGLRVGSLEASEGSTGDKWVAPLTVTSGHVYILYITNIHATNRQFALSWTQLTDPSGNALPNLLDCTVLPVELLYLKADSRGLSIDLTWATATERNSSHFIIERSSDAIDFKPIGEMPAAGDSQQAIDYGFTDASPLNGMNYYRLQQVDRDGASVYTYVVVAMAGLDTDTPMVYPNPVKDRLLTTFNVLATGPVDVQVIDAMGRVAKQLPMNVERGRRVAEIDAQGLVPGAYLIHIVSANGELIGNTRFIKE
ncbi:MAG TPA: T9SS type A sorting domain-containing protein, partial [Flavobacteriales bacterium]|nr:T9SS type A sorting domain-containing protein [Flavobacteriales bacterium]